MQAQYRDRDELADGWEWLLRAAAAADCELNRGGREVARALLLSLCSMADIARAVAEGPVDVRVKALFLVSLCEGVAVQSALTRTLQNDSDEVVRHEAAYYLGTIRENWSIEALGSALRDDVSELVRHEAAEALGEQCGPIAAASLAEAMTDSSELVRRTAEIALVHVERMAGMNNSHSDER